MKKQIVGFGIATGALVAVGGVQQVQAADTVVNLAMTDYSAISATASITVTPTITQIAAGEVTTTTNPITLTLTSTNGSEVTLAGNGGTLADADLAVSHNGSTWVSAADAGATTFFSSSTTQNGTTLPVNVKISNLGGYEVGNYANTLTFTIVAAE